MCQPIVPRSCGVQSPLVRSSGEPATRRAARPGDGPAEAAASSTKSTPGTTGRRLKRDCHVPGREAPAPTRAGLLIHPAHDRVVRCRFRRGSSYALSPRATVPRVVNRMSRANGFASSNARMTLQAGSPPGIRSSPRLESPVRARLVVCASRPSDTTKAALQTIPHCLQILGVGQMDRSTRGNGSQQPRSSRRAMSTSTGRA